MTPAQRKNLDRLLAPRHIAFIGGRDAAVAVGEAHRINYPGAIWPVNPRRDQIGGHACFRSVADLPEAPDAVFLAVPPDAAIESLVELRDMRAGGVVCYTAGFREMGNVAGEAALIEAAGDMALIGPNCYGVINYLSRTALWPFAHGGECPGYGAAIITQSGMLSSDLTMNQRSVPLTHMISIGNQAVLSIEDLIGPLAEQTEVRAIGLHIEGLRDVPAFERAALAATRADVPIVALKTGSSLIGQSLTVSHTGSLSGEDDLYDALFRRVGVIRVNSPAAMLETLKLLCVTGAPKGRAIAGFTCSGGGATMLADHGEKIGLNYPIPPKAVADELTGLLPPIATVSNPLDYTTPIWGQAELTRPVFQAALEAPADFAVLVQDFPAAGLDESRPLYLADADAFADACLAKGIPAAICATLSENMDRATRKHLIARGIAPMQGVLETLDAITESANWSRTAARLREEEPAPLLALDVPGNGTILVEEDVAKRRLAEHGMPVPEGIVGSADEVVRLAQGVGFPVALKMLGPGLAHKTEAGAVALDLGCGQAVSDAADKMRERVGQISPEALTDRFLVERMQPPPLAELLVSIRRDPQFGLALTLGSGGVLVELVGDRETLLLPSTSSEIEAAIDRLRVARLLGGYRGSPAVDMKMLAHEILRIVQIPVEMGSTFAELEINPLFVHTDSVCAVDALLRIHSASGQPDPT